jgi:hypothetical protein
MAKPRAAEPREPRARKLEVAPVIVSQRTSLQVLGIPGTCWPDWVRSLGIPHRRIGQLTLVRVEDALAKLGPEDGPAESAPEASADPAAAVRDALGLRRRGAP